MLQISSQHIQFILNSICRLYEGMINTGEIVIALNQFAIVVLVLLVLIKYHGMRVKTYHMDMLLL